MERKMPIIFVARHVARVIRRRGEGGKKDAEGSVNPVSSTFGRVRVLSLERSAPPIPTTMILDVGYSDVPENRDSGYRNASRDLDRSSVLLSKRFNV